MSVLVKIAEFGRSAAEICDTREPFEIDVHALRMRAAIPAIELGDAEVTVACG